MNIEFTEETVQRIFGSEAAEDERIDRLKEYYFKGDVYEKIHNTLPLRILVGHKGIGKSATFKVSQLENTQKNMVSIFLRPDDIMEICNNDNTILEMIRNWKIGLSNKIFHKVMQQVGIDEHETIKTINVASKLIGKVTEIFKKTIEEKLDFSIIKNDTIHCYLKNNKIFVYIDDLDRGWEGAQLGIKRISALLNAARDLTNENEGLCIRISLRSDVYFLVRTSDESTDKIEGSVVWYKWNQHQILVMLAKRIQTYIGNKIDEKRLLKTPQFEVAKYFNDVFEERFMGYGKWADVPMHKILASMIRRRPRDLVKLSTLAAKTAKENGHSKITTFDLIDNFDYYSQERIQDTVNEYKSELPEIERLIMGMKPSNRERHTIGAFIYSTEELKKKLNIIQSRKHFVFSNGNEASIDELAGFLYKINFLVGRKEVEGGDRIDRRYFEDHKYLSNRFIDFGYQWEVHPAFRWALYPDAGKDVFTTLSVDNEM